MFKKNIYINTDFSENKQYVVAESDKNECLTPIESIRCIEFIVKCVVYNMFLQLSCDCSFI